MLKPLSVFLKNGESFAISIVTGFYNLITPFRGGMAVRAVYLKKKHSFPYTNFLATLGASYVLIFLVSGILGLISTYFIYKSSSSFSPIIFIIFLITTLSMLSIILFAPKITESESKWLNRFIRVINGWHLIKNNNRVIVTVTLLSLIQILIGSLMLYLQFRVFGFTISYPSAVFLSSIGTLGILIGITPANLGIGEAITVFSALTLGISATQSLTATLLGRAVQIIVLFILGTLFSYVLIKK